jgi:hypothetical protein
MKHTAFSGRLLILGFGSIGQGVLPLILRHIDMPKDRIEILTSDARGEAIAAQHGIRHTILPLTRENYAAELNAPQSSRIQAAHRPGKPGTVPPPPSCANHTADLPFLLFHVLLLHPFA